MDRIGRLCRRSPKTLGIADRVEWAGYIRDPAPLLRTLDVFALSSDTEQMPLSLLEAMAAGFARCLHRRPATCPPSCPPSNARSSCRSTTPRWPERSTPSRPTRRCGNPSDAQNRARATAEFGQCTMFKAWEQLYSER